MNLSTFEQSKKNENSSYGESVRLSNELRARESYSYVDEDGFTVNVPAKWGFDCETAPYSDFTSWLNDATIKKSASLFWFVIRIMCVRFSEKHSEIRNNLSDARKLEFDFILSNMKNEIEWIGRVGYQNQVELNPQSPLNKSNIKIVSLKNDGYRTEKK